MEKGWVTADEITNRGLLSKINLVDKVQSGVLTAYGHHTFLPVDWDAIKRQFNEIKEMCGQQIPGEKQQNVRVTNPYTGQPSTSLKSVQCQIDPIKILHNEQQQDRNGNTRHTPRLSWDILHDLLTRQSRPTIPVSQYEEILAGWGGRQIEEIVLHSIYRKADILKITGQEPSNENQGGPQQTKARNTLLRIIGALVTVHYLGKTGQKYQKSNGSANIDAIAKGLHGQLSAAGYSYDGMKGSTLRDTISEALGILEDNKQ